MRRRTQYAIKWITISNKMKTIFGGKNSENQMDIFSFSCTYFMCIFDFNNITFSTKCAPISIHTFSVARERGGMVPCFRVRLTRFRIKCMTSDNNWHFYPMQIVRDERAYSFGTFKGIKGQFIQSFSYSCEFETGCC